MNVAITRTVAEKTLAEQFEDVLARLPGGEGVRADRRAAIGEFAGLGLPHRRIEEWKYTDLRQAIKAVGGIDVEPGAVSSDTLLSALGPLSAFAGSMCVLVDGVYRDDLSTFAGASGVSARPLSERLAQSGDLMTSETAIAEPVPSGLVATLRGVLNSPSALLRIRLGCRTSSPSA